MKALEILFWVGLFTVFYAYLGYGILLFVGIKIKRLFSTKETVFDANFTPKVALIVPCFNEEKYIAEKIEDSLKLDYPKDQLEIIFISDGSNDQTAAIVRDHTSKGIIAMHEDKRAGKAAAMNRAVKATQAEILVFCDANTALNSKAIREIVKHYQNAKIGAVAGQKRIVEKDADSASGAGEGIYWKYESALKKWDGELYTVVGAAGELMSYRRALYEELPADTLLDDFMQSMRVCEKGYRVVYEPNANATETASANVQEELKRKIRISAGGWQSMFRLKKAGNPFYNFILWFQYVSHRIMRWSIAPLSLILIFIVNAILAGQSTFYFVVFILQLAFYSLAIIGWILENKSIRLKVLYIPYYFFIMNYSVYMGFFRFLKGSQSSLWERAKRA
ncbi:MAG: glycosyl transferase [Crocinitomicaceae bacterium]|nr:glycosyl transferase [Crocinitomicaceae bacterium]